MSGASINPQLIQTCYPKHRPALAKQTIRRPPSFQGIFAIEQNFELQSRSNHGLSDSPLSRPLPTFKIPIYMITEREISEKCVSVWGLAMGLGLSDSIFAHQYHQELVFPLELFIHLQLQLLLLLYHLVNLLFLL